MVLFLRNKRFTVMLFFGLITIWGGGDYQLRSALAAKQIWVAVITIWGTLDSLPRFGIEIDVVGLSPLTWPLFLYTIPPFGNSWLRARFKKSYYPTSDMHSLHAGSEGMQMFPAKQFYILQRKVRGVICTSAHK